MPDRAAREILRNGASKDVAVFGERNELASSRSRCMAENSLIGNLAGLGIYGSDHLSIPAFLLSANCNTPVWQKVESLFAF